MTTEEFPVKNIPEMFCFAGNNTSIETSKIKEMECLYWYGNDNDLSIPVLMITLQDGTKVSADFDSKEEVEEAIKAYKKHINFRVVK
ncbi:MAG: hypothetical protein IKU37_08930 [Candidatus Gastranaerophilales bacterium]|nr:hypothetical protein [Candidatus Gastranaerophilales bacterium]